MFYFNVMYLHHGAVKIIRNKSENVLVRRFFLTLFLDLTSFRKRLLGLPGERVCWQVLNKRNVWGNVSECRNMDVFLSKSMTV